MKKVLFIVVLSLFVGCASERKVRTVNQILSPDKMNMQLHVNPDIGHNQRTTHEIQQLRIGFDWNL